MNKEQRKRLAELYEQLSSVLDEVESIKDDEECKYDNLPESLQDSEKGEQLQEGIDALDEVYSYLSDAQSSLEELL